MSLLEKKPHPLVWFILYFPFGGLGGFVSIALTFLATQNGLSIIQGSLIIGSQVLISWLKWLWAPIVDITLSPKKWYVISTTLSGLAIILMAAIPLNEKNLSFILLIIAFANFINSIVGMAVEAMIAHITPKDQIGRVSAWLQAGCLGSGGFFGALGLFLIQHLPKNWMAGIIIGVLFMSCCLALLTLPEIKILVIEKNSRLAMKKVFNDFWLMIKERAGILTSLLCFLPISTGAAQGVLTQAAVAAYWGAGVEQVELIQGVLSGIITIIGCFLGGWLCSRINVHLVYVCFAILLSAIAAAMAYCPANISMYMLWNLIYSLGVGLSCAAFTAIILVSLNPTIAATGYTVFASMTNFPIWWLGLLLGWVAEKYGPRPMLLTEATMGALGVIIFIFLTQRLWRSTNSTYGVKVFSE